jgi:hypothetical protein
VSDVLVASFNAIWATSRSSWPSSSHPSETRWNAALSKSDRSSTIRVRWASAFALDRTRRLWVSPRGVRTSIGPRGARLHFGSGYRPGISTGAGPFTYYHPIGSRKSPARRAGTGRTSVSAYEREVRRAAREQEWSAALSLDQSLTTDFLTEHRRVFSQHVRDVLEPPPEIDRKAIFKQVWSERKRGISFFRLSARKGAKKAAREETGLKVAELRIEAQKEIAAQQAEIDHQWTLLLNNDPNTVVAALEDEFEETEAPAAPLGCHDGTLSVLLRFPRIDGIVGRPGCDSPRTKSSNPELLPLTSYGPTLNSEL